ncbi:MAG TPA: sigma-E factor negative regulatory protein [Rhodocyclaceae bacterium]|jgi:sigma-E factor negative regulatory protein RseA|nr:sigma-E factor negative regulatory protein [Rhodocyclaceae bacterium]HRQ48298.1 sigma-E factor negative regulatory protein [Rhodocyclaceae bacterium]
MKDELSALLDGDLDEASARPVFESIRRDPALVEKWNAYCLIGDALRGDAAGFSDVSERVMARIRGEPTLLAPPATAAAEQRAPGWRSAMPVAASVMGVAAVGLVAFTLYSQPDDQLRHATAPGSVQTVERAPVRSVVPVTSADREDAHRKYVFVHQAMSGGGPIPGAVQYVRTVSEARGDVRR